MTEPKSPDPSPLKPLDYAPPRRSTLTLGRIFHLSWLILLALALYMFPLWTATHIAWYTETFWLNLLVLLIWPFLAWYLIKRQWAESATDNVNHCSYCGAALLKENEHCPNCRHLRS